MKWCCENRESRAPRKCGDKYRSTQTPPLCSRDARQPHRAGQGRGVASESDPRKRALPWSTSLDSED
jgi:hypothetical protein